MNEQQAKWLESYIDSGDAIKAVSIAYPDVKKENRASKASHLKSNLINEIDNHGRAQYKKDVPMMLNVIKEIALNGEQEAVRIKAANTWLSRAGHDAAQVIEVKKTVTHEDLLQRLQIAATGIDPELLKSVLPGNLIKDITPKEAIKNEPETQH